VSRISEKFNPRIGLLFLRTSSAIGYLGRKNSNVSLEKRPSLGFFPAPNLEKQQRLRLSPTLDRSF